VQEDKEVPIVRGRFLPEVESTGRQKKLLDVLMWGTNWGDGSLQDLDDIEVLRECLRSMRPSFCGIRLLVPAAHAATAEVLRYLNVAFVAVEGRSRTFEASKDLGDKELADAVETALAYDADVLAVNRTEWLPFADDLERLGLFLTDTSFLKNYCEIFVRGHDIPWSFSNMIWGLTWNGFYHMTEQRTLGTGMDFLHAATRR
jgi:hypothetical protein